MIQLQYYKNIFQIRLVEKLNLNKSFIQFYTVKIISYYNHNF